MTSLFITLGVILLDFISKNIVKAVMQLGDSIVLIPNVLNITFVLNKGAAWGMFADRRWIFMVFSTVAIAVIAVILAKSRKSHLLFRTALSLVLGGGIGNMIDRTFYGEKLFSGAVVDFLEAAFIDFPVFNIADSAVCIGVALMFGYIIFFDGKKGTEIEKVSGDSNAE